MAEVKDYTDIVGKPVIDELFILGDRASKLKIQHINSTAVGGGVAEILNRLIPMFGQVGVKSRWDVIKGDERFFLITKKMHNALHGVNETFTKEELNFFLEINKKNSSAINFDGDVVFIHDPQPIGLVEKRSQLNSKWVWRCHIDFSEPKEQIWLFLKNYIEKFDSAVFSAPAFSRKIATRQILISPSIDPLSDKNKSLDKNYIDSVFDRFKIDRSRPVVTQISRFDYLKDPVGVL